MHGTTRTNTFEHLKIFANWLSLGLTQLLLPLSLLPSYLAVILPISSLSILASRPPTGFDLLSFYPSLRLSMRSDDPPLLPSFRGLCPRSPLCRPGTPSPSRLPSFYQDLTSLFFLKAVSAFLPPLYHNLFACTASPPPRLPQGWRRCGPAAWPACTGCCSGGVGRSGRCRPARPQTSTRTQTPPNVRLHPANHFTT